MGPHHSGKQLGISTKDLDICSSYSSNFIPRLKKNGAHAYVD